MAPKMRRLGHSSPLPFLHFFLSIRRFPANDLEPFPCNLRLFRFLDSSGMRGSSPYGADPIRYLWRNARPILSRGYGFDLANGPHSQHGVLRLAALVPLQSLLLF